MFAYTQSSQSDQLTDELEAFISCYTTLLVLAVVKGGEGLAGKVSLNDGIAPVSGDGYRGF